MKAAIRIAFLFAIFFGIFVLVAGVTASNMAQGDPDSVGTWLVVKNLASIVVGAVIVFGLIYLYTGERAKVESQLRKTLAGFRLLFQGNPVPVWVCNLDDLKFLAANKAALNEYGYTLEELLASSATMFHLPEDVDRARTFFKRAKPSVSASQWRHRRKDGSFLDVELIFQSIVFGGKEARLVVAQNVTLRNSSEKALTKALSEYIEARGALGAAQFRPGEVKNLDVAYYLRTLADEFFAPAVRSGIKLDFDLNPHSPTQLRVDAARLDEVMRVLLGSTLKFAKGAVVTVRIGAVVDLGLRSELQIAVCDEGMGEEKTLFEAERRSSARAVRPTEAISNWDSFVAGELCKLMGAALRYEGTRAGGGQFIVCLQGRMEAGVFVVENRDVAAASIAAV